MKFFKIIHFKTYHNKPITIAIDEKERTKHDERGMYAANKCTKCNTYTDMYTANECTKCNMYNATSHTIFKGTSKINSKSKNNV